MTADKCAVVLGGEESETGLHIPSADGWGPLLGDEGSAVWIALQGLRAAMRHMDGRGPATSLAKLVLGTLGVQCPYDLAANASLDPAGLEWILQVFPVCIQAAQDKDAVAMSIVASAAEALAQSCAAVLGQLGDGDVPVATAGMVLGHDLVRGEFERQLAKLAPEACLQEPILPPETGAALLALLRYAPVDDFAYGLEELAGTLSSS